jgi:hypothetical protein
MTARRRTCASSCKTPRRIEKAAALLLDTRRRSPEDEIRYTNAIERLLASVEARQARDQELRDVSATGLPLQVQVTLTGNAGPNCDG